MGAAIITSVDLGHEHIEGSDAASLAVKDAVKLTSLTTTKLDETGHITLTNLPKMTSLDLSSMVTLPILGAYTITISETGLSGSYIEASIKTTTTDVVEDLVYSNDLVTLKPLMVAGAATTDVTYTFAGDILSSVTTRTWSIDGNGVATAGAASTSTATLANNAASVLYSLRNASTVVSKVFSEADFDNVVAQP